MSKFTYPALDLSKDKIRLLRVIRADSLLSDVFCSLFESTTDSEEGTPYKALSYTWGDVEWENDTRHHLPRVFVDNVEVDATDNLRLALLNIRNSKCDEVLWIDAICINQKDNREKGHQVKQMGHIYQNAEDVLIWLGPSNEAIRDLFELITMLDQRARDISTPVRHGEWIRHCHDLLVHQYEKAKTPQNIGALKQLMSRRWFRRIWILQEVAMARTARILCGSSSCPARMFSLIPLFFKISTTAHLQAVLDLMPRARGNTWWAKDRSLHSLLVKFAKSEATEPRDKVCALLGMSHDACDPTRFYPSYEGRDAEFYTNTALFLVFGRVLNQLGFRPIIDIADLSLPLEGIASKLLEQAIRLRCTPVFRKGFQFRLRFDNLIGQLSLANINTVVMLKELSDCFGTTRRKYGTIVDSNNRDARSLFVTETAECYEFQARTSKRPDEVSILVLEKSSISAMG
ncbi:hypothetical protein FGRMN_984 [Fusarium graminum]|nr:hypothetical protein FGRMN_984 [Fusarium graminum]